MKPLVHFAHGKESGPWGTKIKALAQVARAKGFDVESLDYSGIEDAAARAAKLVDACRGLERPLILAGSSMGGWVAAAAAEKIPCQGLFLLAPALLFPGYPQVAPLCTGECIEVVHGWRDEVILYEHSVRFCVGVGATLHLVEDDHRLIASLARIEEYFARFLDRVHP